MAKWKGHGLFSGVMRRLFETFDLNQSGCVSFDQYLVGYSQLTRPEPETRLRVAFRFFDLDGNKLISFEELVECFGMLHGLYSGEETTGQMREHGDLYATVLVEQVRQDQRTNAARLSVSNKENLAAVDLDQGLPFVVFRRYIALHSHTQKFFGLGNYGLGS
jgi:hypothetical protein